MPRGRCTTALKRVEATQKARELAEQNLQAEREAARRRPVGHVPRLQAQRDLTDQLNNELTAIIAYNRALMNFEAVQVVPPGRGILTRLPASSFQLAATKSLLAPTLEAGSWQLVAAVLHSPCEADRHGHHPERGRQHRGRARVGLLGRRDRRRRLAQHRRHRRDRRAVRRPRRRPRLARLQRAEELRRRDRRRTTGSCRSTPTSASRRSSPPRSATCMREGSDARRLSHAARHLLPRALDPRHRLVSRLPAAALRPARAAAGTAGASTSRSSCRQAGRDSCSTSCSTTPTATSPITSRRSITTRRSPPSSGWPRDAGPTPLEIAVHPPVAFLRNYVARGAASATARRASSSRC